MKGIVFTEFLEMVEERFSSEMADDILESAVLESGGAYTAVGTYDHKEMVRLVDQLSAKTGIPADNLLREFGERLFGRFEVGHRAFFAGVDSAFGFLKSVEGHIHVEVLKLYPDAELPSFECGEPAPGQLAMVYRSSRPFSALAEGLIKGCAAHFGETIDIQSERLPDGRGTRFLLTKRPQP